jgi:cytochrome c oxidase subunit 3
VGERGQACRPRTSTGNRPSINAPYGALWERRQKHEKKLKMKMKNNIIENKFKFQNYGFHLVTKSPWPILVSFSLLNLAIGAVLSMHGFNNGSSVITLGLITTIFAMGLWFRDIVIEGTFLGDHTKRVRSGISIGVLLFIISEAFAFFSVFWSFFHSALSPSIEIGGIWPPFGLTTLNSFGLPLTNTVLLLSSGAYITLAHHSLIGRIRKTSLDGSFVTLILAILFTFYQGIEYSEASFSFSDSVFGTVFFASTGLHGFHVIVGTLFLLYGIVRIYSYHSTSSHHVGLESAIAYWHFVDVVWLFLFIVVYI